MLNCTQKYEHFVGGSGKSRIFQKEHQMDYIRLIINIVLTIVFYYFFGSVNITKFSKASVSFTKLEETMTRVPSPGKEDLNNCNG